MKSKTELTSGVVALQKVNGNKVNQSRTLRKKMTKAEEVLWENIRNRKLDGLKFRRQQESGVSVLEKHG